MKKYLKLLAAGLLVAVSVEFFNIPAMATSLRTLVLTTLTATTATITTLIGTTMTTSTLAATGAVSTTGASLSVSSGTSAGATAFKFRGAYTSAAIAGLTALPGEVVFNTTVSALCPSTGTAAGLVGAFVMPSTATTVVAKDKCW